MNSALVSTLKEGRKKAGLTQTQVAAQLGIRQSVLSQWETGKFEPDIDTFLTLLKMYGLDYRAVFPEIQEAENNKSKTITDEEHIFIDKLRHLNDRQKNLVIDLVDEFVDQIAPPAVDNETSPQYIPLIRIPYFSSAPSAGSGNELFEEVPQIIRIKSTNEAQNADYVLRVDGQSMEPAYYDGDLILVKKQDFVDDGDIGIFCVDGVSYIKQKESGYLHSINPDYDDIKLNEFSSAYTLGKVIGKAEV